MLNLLNMYKTFLLLFLLTINTSYSQGEISWEFETKDRIKSSPIVDGQTIYFGSSDGNIYAVKLK